MKPLLILLLFISGSTFPQNKLALIVAVGQYPPISKLRPIASVNDVKYIKAALRKNGFPEKNIDTLINAQATKEAILAKLRDLAQIADKNDIVVIHFSCHGQQIRDQKTVALGKDEDDGYDEALLPYDARANYNPTGYKGEKHLRDDDLYPLLLAIRQKLGAKGSMLVLLDACHSGTGTRDEGFASSRGEPVPFPDPENPMDSVIDLSAAEAKQGFFDKMADSMSNMVVISASSPHQLNKQVIVNNEELGSLSYSFYKAISEMSAGNTYELLFEKIKATIQAFIAEQLPMMEGNSNQLIFSGQYVAKSEKTYIRVGYKEGPATNDSIFTVDKGMLDNMIAGTHCTIYKNGSAVAYANATIKKAENFKSIGVADKILDIAELYELKQEEENYGALTAAIKLKYEGPATSSKKFEQEITRLITANKFLSLSDKADFQLEVKNKADGKIASLVDRNNHAIWSAPFVKDDSLSADNKNELLTSIKKNLRVKYLRIMPDGGDLSSFVTAAIIPAKEFNAKNGINMVEGDAYSLSIRNNSEYSLYYTVLDIYPDNNVEVLYPYIGKEPADYLVFKKSVITRKLAVSKGSPVGVEYLKIIIY